MATSGINPIQIIKNAVNNVVNPVGSAASAINSATGDAVGKAAKSAANDAGQATGLGDVGTDISTISGFASALGNKTLWIRTGKIVIGGGLLLIGVAHLTGVDNKVAKAAIKAAPFLV
jgi:hypothetical protein